MSHPVSVEIASEISWGLYCMYAERDNILTKKFVVWNQLNRHNDLSENYQLKSNIYQIKLTVFTTIICSLA